MAAVSNSVMPRSIALWITLREDSRSVRWPKLLQPRPTAETRRPEPPRLRICMEWSCGAWAKRQGKRGICIVARAQGRRKVRSYREAPGDTGLICENKKKRPRSDAATDGDRWGA